MTGGHGVPPLQRRVLTVDACRAYKQRWKPWWVKATCGHAK